MRENVILAHKNTKNGGILISEDVVFVAFSRIEVVL